MSELAVYLWKEDDIHRLIKKRVENAAWFKGRRGSGKLAWERIANLLDCGASADQCQKKWLNLLAKYKLIIIPKTGISLEDEEHEAHTWPFFNEINKYMSERETINPAALIDSVSEYDSHAGCSTPRSKTARAIRDVPAGDSDDEDTPGVVVKPKKKKATSATEAATLDLIARMDKQIERSNEQIERSIEQAESNRNEQAMLEILKQHFAQK